MDTLNKLPEEFLYYIWENKLFDQNNLITTEDKRLIIIEIGKHNSDSGPDFFNAKVKIEDTIWAGNIRLFQYFFMCGITFNI